MQQWNNNSRVVRLIEEKNMNYLFFDIECANCFEGKAKICEFGYVLINEQFEIIKKELFLINPKESVKRV